MTTAIKTVDGKRPGRRPDGGRGRGVIGEGREGRGDMFPRFGKAHVIPEDECYSRRGHAYQALGTCAKKLIDMIENPPKPNAALHRDSKRY